MSEIVFSILALIGGMAFFLFGMHVMSENLEKMAGGHLEQMLRKVTANPFIGLVVGAVITIAMQSSSATTVLLVGLVNSGILTFAKTLGAIFGANIGTTLTGWILTLSSIEGSGWVALLKPKNFSPVLALIGVGLLMFSKKDRKHSVGKVLIGFAVMMYGMTAMSDSVALLAEQEWFANALIQFQNPILGLFVALAVTAVIQSSAASIGIMQALSMTAATGLTYGAVVPMVMGLNIGTCATSLISCIGTGTGARRVATVHVMIKILGAVICLPLFLLATHLFDWQFVNDPVNPVSIALIHTVYNVLITVILMPLTKPLVKLTERLVKDRKNEKDRAKDREFSLDDRLLRSPSVAIAECGNRTSQMSQIATDSLIKTFSILYAYDASTADWILEQEDKLDRLEDLLGTYLVKLPAKSLSQADSRAITKMLHAIGDFERMGDHAVNLLKTSKEIYQKEISFSPQATEELRVLTEAVTEILNLTAEAYQTNSPSLASNVEPLEQVIDDLIDTIRDNHIQRLQKGHCTIELGFVLSDLLTNMERISDHCSNVAVTVIETAHDSFDTHEYLNAIKEGEDAEFQRKFHAYGEKYRVGAAQ